MARLLTCFTEHRLKFVRSSLALVSHKKGENVSLCMVGVPAYTSQCNCLVNDLSYTRFYKHWSRVGTLLCWYQSIRLVCADPRWACNSTVTGGGVLIIRVTLNAKYVPFPRVQRALKSSWTQLFVKHGAIAAPDLLFIVSTHRPWSFVCYQEINSVSLCLQETRRCILLSWWGTKVSHVYHTGPHTLF